jgi:hypothetical protein
MVSIIAAQQTIAAPSTNATNNATTAAKASICMAGLASSNGARLTLNPRHCEARSEDPPSLAKRASVGFESADHPSPTEAFAETFRLATTGFAKAGARSAEVEAIQSGLHRALDCFAPLAMT